MNSEVSILSMIKELREAGVGDQEKLAFFEKVIGDLKKSLNNDDSNYVLNLYKTLDQTKLNNEKNSVDEEKIESFVKEKSIENQDEKNVETKTLKKTVMDVRSLNRFVAGSIIDKLRGGQPPSYGIRTYSVGLESVLSVIDKEQIENLEHCGSSFFKFIEAPYGSGKTHFIYQFRELTMTKDPGFANVLIKLDNKSTSIKDLEVVLIQIFREIEFPKTLEQIEECISNPVKCEEEVGFINQLRIFLETKKNEFNNEVEFIKFLDKIRENVLKDSDNPPFSEAMIVLMDGIILKDYEKINDISNFLQNKLENSKMRKYNLKKITNENAILFLKSLIRFLRNIGYSGLVVSFDETEVKLAMNDRKRIDAMKSVHSIFDQIYSFKLNNLIVLFSVLDKSQIISSGYGAIISRVTEEFSMVSPGNPWLNLEKIVKDNDDDYWKSNLRSIGRKIQRLYERSKEIKFDEDNMEETLENMANVALKFKRGEIANKRSFIQKIIRVFDTIKANPDKIFSEDEARELFVGNGNPESDVNVDELKDDFEN